MVDKVEKIDPLTVKFTLKSPFAEFPQLVGGSFQAKVAPRDVADLNKNPTGTGPFKLTEFVPGDHVTLVRNEAYWRDGEPYLDQVRIVYLPEEAAHVAGMLSGDLDMTWWPSAEVLPIYQANKDIPSRSLRATATSRLSCAWISRRSTSRKSAARSG
jgi:peptide/nickel transport system substrate-binding protein